ncbi:hypothetical protein [Streptomyces phaeofaciens]|uniref:hypothetical protein n=1 Tax=Streptomyces phaeofaciens TaxID=68254 RepID=UPI0036A39071
MAVHTLKRRIAALGAALGLGVALPFAVGVTPAYAQSARLSITKTQVGSFVRGGEGVYRITVVNTGDQESEESRMTDIFPEGLTFRDLAVINYSPTVDLSCRAGSVDNRLECETSQLDPGEGYTIEVTLAVAADAPCTITNTAGVFDPTLGHRGSRVTVTTSIPGPDCNGGGGPLLPVTLDGVIPMFNNITTNSNIDSPGAANVSNQDFAVNAP